MSARNRTLGLEIEAEAARAEILACGVMSGTESLQHWDSARTAKRLRRGSNANSLRGQNSAGFLEICAAFQRDNLRRHFRVRVLPPQPRSRSLGRTRVVVAGNAKGEPRACLGRSRGSPVTRRWPGQSPAGRSLLNRKTPIRAGAECK
jgi:hypothetical protein